MDVHRSVQELLHNDVGIMTDHLHPSQKYNSPSPQTHSPSPTPTSPSSGGHWQKVMSSSDCTELALARRWIEVSLLLHRFHVSYVVRHCVIVFLFECYVLYSRGCVTILDTIIYLYRNIICPFTIIIIVEG